MTRFFTLLVFLSLGISAQAQITRDITTFPAIGDILRESTDSVPNLFILSPSATPQSWDFSNLDVNSSRVYDINAASSGSAAATFPTADLIYPVFGGQGYLRDDGSSMEALGFYGDPLGILGANVTVEFDNTWTMLYEPMTYGTTHGDSLSFYLELGGADVDPDLPLAVNVDSARMQYDAWIVDTVDAYGTMLTPTGSYPVLRVKRTEYRFTNADVKVPFFNWINANQYFPELGADTLVTMIWVDDVSKLSITEVDLRDNGSTRHARFMVDATVIPTLQAQGANIIAGVYPNPASSIATFFFEGLESGNYMIDISNAIGQTLQSEQVNIMNQSRQEVQVSVDDLAAGTYFYSLRNQEGAILKTQMLVVHKP